MLRELKVRSSKILEGEAMLVKVKRFSLIAIVIALVIQMSPLAYAEEISSVSEDIELPESISHASEEEPTVTPEEVVDGLEISVGEATIADDPPRGAVEVGIAYDVATVENPVVGALVENRDHVPGEMVVVYKSDVPEEAIDEVVAAVDGDLDTVAAEYDDATLASVSIPEDADVEAAAEMVEQDDRILYAAPNYLYELCDSTEEVIVAESDVASATPSFSSNDSFASHLWHLDSVNAAAAWRILAEQGIQQTVRVAIIDTGVNFYHEDLSGIVDTNSSVEVLTNGTKKALRGDGFVNGGILRATTGHGTHVAGIVAARADNGRGVAGVGSCAGTSIRNSVIQLVGIDAFSRGDELSESASDLEIAIALNHAKEVGCQVANLSLELKAGFVSATLEGAINSFVAGGGTVVAAAGNTGKNQVIYPGAYANTIGVINCTASGTRQSTSTYGSSYDLCAPGENIVSTSGNSNTQYVQMTGTSMAAPVVSATVAMMYAMVPNLTFDEVRSILTSTALDVGAQGFDDQTGWGRLRADLAVDEACKPFVTASGMAKNYTGEPLSPSINVTLRGKELSEDDYRVYYGDSLEPPTGSPTATYSCDVRVEVDETVINGASAATIAESASAASPSSDEDVALISEPDAAPAAAEGAQEPANSFRFSNGELVSSAEGASTDDADASASDDASDPQIEERMSAYGLVTNPSGFNVFDTFDTFSQGKHTRSDAAHGIDVSRWNGSIDWARVKASGIDFALIRCGYGDDLSYQDDPYWYANVRGCLANSIPFGVYLYSYATNTTMARSEASHVLRLLSAVGLTPDSVALPIFLDMEDESTASLSNASLANIAHTFYDVLAAQGYEVGVYSSRSWWETKLTSINRAGLSKWVAEWNASSGLTYSGFTTLKDSDGGIWQFSDYGIVPGISGRVDLNYAYIDKWLQPTATAVGMAKNYTGEPLAPEVTIKTWDGTAVSPSNYTVYYGNSTQAPVGSPTTASSYAVRAEYAAASSGQGTMVFDLGTFTIYPNPSGISQSVYALASSAAPSFALDLSGGRASNGSRAQMWTYYGGENQLVTFVFDERNGQYSIRNAAAPAFALDVSGGVATNGSKVQAWSYYGGANQSWAVEEKPDGTYVFHSASASEHVLEAAGGTPSNGSRVQMWTYHGGAAQRWFLRER